MGTTFVRIEDDKGFWMNDGVLELWLRLLALHIEDPEDADDQSHANCVQKIRDQWLFASRGYFTGCVPIRLDHAVSTEPGRQIVLAAIRSLMKALETAPECLDKGVLNVIGFSGPPFQGDFETSRMLEIGQAFIGLIEGRIGFKPNDTSFMPGMPRD